MGQIMKGFVFFFFVRQKLLHHFQGKVGFEGQAFKREEWTTSEQLEDSGESE